MNVVSGDRSYRNPGNQTRVLSSYVNLFYIWQVLFIVVDSCVPASLETSLATFSEYTVSIAFFMCVNTMFEAFLTACRSIFVFFSFGFGQFSCFLMIKEWYTSV